MVKIYPGEYTPQQLALVGATPGIRTATTPFGMPPGTFVRYVGRSVPWKGFKKDPKEPLEEYLRRFAAAFTERVKSKYAVYPDRSVGEAISTGLRTAIDVSRRASLEGPRFGVGIYALADGRQVVLPAKVATQLRIRNKPITVIAEKLYDRNAYEVRRTLGIRGEYKPLIATYMPRAIMVPVPG